MTPVIKESTSPMEPPGNCNTSIVNRRFAMAAAAAAPFVVTALAKPAGKARHWSRDLLQAYEQQHVAVDFDDVACVLRCMTRHELGVGQASGADRANRAAAAAVSEVASLGQNLLVLLAFSPGTARLKEYRAALNVVRRAAGPDATCIYGGCEDPELPPGVIRVSLLSG